MAVRQYVGARYVPKFYQNSTDPSGTEWEGNRSYEALTVVSYNNDSYTSKIPVPAGIGNPASNPTYWARTGAYNAQVEQYRQDVETAVNGVDEKLNQTTTKLEGDIQTLKTDTENSVQQVQTQTNEVQSNLTQEITDRKQADEEITARLGKLTQKFLIIGDSYATVTEGGETNWAITLASLLGNDRCTIKSQGGAGFVNGAFLTLLNSVENDDDITDIILCGGANDLGSTVENINTAKLTFITTAHTKFPNAKIHIGFIGNSKASFNNYSVPRYDMYFTYLAYSTAVSDELVLNGTEYTNLNYTTIKDQTHPTAEWGASIGRYIYASIMTGNCNVTLQNVQTSLRNLKTKEIIANLNALMLNNVASISLAGEINIPLNTTLEYFVGKFGPIARIGEEGIAYPILNFQTPIQVIFNRTSVYTCYLQAESSHEFSDTDKQACISLRTADNYFGSETLTTPITSVTFYPNVQIFAGSLFLF